MEDEQLNNKDNQDQSSEIQTQEDTSSGDGSDDKSEETDGSKDSDESKDEEGSAGEEGEKTPFHKHPRWIKMQDTLKEKDGIIKGLLDEVESIKTTVKQVRDKIGDDDPEDPRLLEIEKELEELDKNRPDTLKDLAKKLRSIWKKQDEIEAEVSKANKSAEETKKEEEQIKARESSVKEYQETFDALIDDGKLEKEEVQVLARWMAEQYESETDKNKKEVYLDIKKSLPLFRKANDVAASNKEKEDQLKSRSGVGDSAGEAGAEINLTPEQLQDLSFADKWKLADKHKK